MKILVAQRRLSDESYTPWSKAGVLTVTKSGRCSFPARMSQSGEFNFAGYCTRRFAIKKLMADDAINYLDYKVGSFECRIARIG